jgi:flagellar motor switch protein FliN/FliY
MSEETDVENVDLTDFSQQEKPSESEAANAAKPDETPPKSVDDTRTAMDLEAVYDVPVNITAVLGRTHMEVANLLKLDEGDVVELDRKVGEAIDIFVNDRLVARGEVVLVEDRLGVTMTEIIKGNA